MKLFEVKRAWTAKFVVTLPGQFRSRIRKSSTLDDPATDQYRNPGQRGW